MCAGGPRWWAKVGPRCVGGPMCVGGPRCVGEPRSAGGPRCPGGPIVFSPVTKIPFLILYLFLTYFVTFGLASKRDRLGGGGGTGVPPSFKTGFASLYLCHEKKIT